MIGLAFDGKRLHLESAVWTPTGLEPTTRLQATSSKSTANPEQAELATLARRIQSRQQQMGLAETPLDTLLGKDAETLAAIAQALGLT